MIIQLYKNNSDNNVLSKRLTGVGSLNVRLKQETSREYPTFILKGNVESEFNYIYIPKWDRYYYVNEFRQISEETYLIICRIDVLMSFKSKILGARAYITSSANLVNNYLPSSKWQADVRCTTNVIEFDDYNTLAGQQQWILVTAGAFVGGE